jgi:hypothetical protein
MFPLHDWPANYPGVMLHWQHLVWTAAALLHLRLQGTLVLLEWLLLMGLYGYLLQLQWLQGYLMQLQWLHLGLQSCLVKVGLQRYLVQLPWLKLGLQGCVMRLWWPQLGPFGSDQWFLI